MAIHAQTKQLGMGDTTSVPLEGTFIKNGKLNLSTGYKLTYSVNNTVVTVAKKAGGETTGSFRCTCEGTGKTGACVVSSVDNAMSCSGASCCGFLITRNPIKITAAILKDSTISWKKLSIPTNTNMNSRN